MSHAVESTTSDAAMSDRAASDPAERAYREGRYDEAAELYRARLAESDAGSVGATLFNLGNCALQTDQPASALWHYRRAELRLPDEPAIAANLRLAERRLGLVVHPPDVGMTRAEVGVSKMPARPPLAAVPDAWLLGASVLLEAAGLFVVFRMRGRVKLAIGTALLLSGVLAAVPLWSRTEKSMHPAAIVLVPEATLLTEPRDTSAAVLRLREGESLQVIETSDTWAHVAHGRDRGWIRLRALGVVD